MTRWTDNLRADCIADSAEYVFLCSLLVLTSLIQKPRNERLLMRPLAVEKSKNHLKSELERKME